MRRRCLAVGGPKGGISIFENYPHRLALAHCLAEGALALHASSMACCKSVISPDVAARSKL